jgi:hypothetical protein
MRYKLVGIFVCMLLICTVIPTSGTIKDEKNMKFPIIFGGDPYPTFNGSYHNGWWNSPVTVSFVFDPEEVAEIWYNYGGWRLYTEPFVIGEEGFTIVFYYWIDYEGVQYPIAFFNLSIDQTPPEAKEICWESYKEDEIWYLDFIASATDETSGMDRVECFIEDEYYETIIGDGPEYIFKIKYTDELLGKTLYFYHYDRAGNEIIVDIWLQPPMPPPPLLLIGIISNRVVTDGYTSFFAVLVICHPLLFPYLIPIIFQNLSAPNDYIGYIGRHLICAIIYPNNESKYSLSNNLLVEK